MLADLVMSELVGTVILIGGWRGIKRIEDFRRGVGLGTLGCAIQSATYGLVGSDGGHCRSKTGCAAAVKRCIAKTLYCYHAVWR